MPVLDHGVGMDGGEELSLELRPCHCKFYVCFGKPLRRETYYRHCKKDLQIYNTLLIVVSSSGLKMKVWSRNAAIKETMSLTCSIFCACKPSFFQVKRYDM